MPDRTEPTNPTDARGPWPEVTGLDQLYDYGVPWCANAAGHPDPDAGYPDAEIHVPPFECRTAGHYIEDVRFELDGDGCGLEVYAAQPYRFGEPRSAGPRPATRVVLDFFDDAGVAPVRFSLPLGETVRLGRLLMRLVDRVTDA